MSISAVLNLSFSDTNKLFSFIASPFLQSLPFPQYSGGSSYATAVLLVLEISVKNSLPHSLLLSLIC
jgi:hypothetical protein